ncbi:MAG: hypothetical protein MUE41_17565, partial [Gemmatimonadaceae bacterium]|nr:hypothetical protein [Gemmatimonadaceae bacterium]
MTLLQQPAVEVHATQALVGFFQSTWQDDVYVGVLETDADGTRATFTVGCADAAGRHLTLRRVESEHPGIRAIDATVQGGELVL